MIRANWAKKNSKTYDALRTIDCGILVISNNEFGFYEMELVKQFREFNIPFVVVHNKSDIQPINELTNNKVSKITKAPVIDFSVVTGLQTNQLIEALKNHSRNQLSKTFAACRHC